MLSIMAAQGLHNQSQKPCLLSSQVRSPPPTNDSLPTRLVTRRTACSTSQRALRNTRKTHLRLKCFPSTDADNSLPQPARLLLLRMAISQTVHLQPLVYDVCQMWAPAAFRWRTRVRLHACNHPLPPLGASRHQQRRHCITFYTSFNSRHAHVQRLNPKCKSGPA